MVTVDRIGLGTTRLTRPWHIDTLRIRLVLFVTNVAWHFVTPDRPSSEHSIRTWLVALL